MKRKKLSAKYAMASLFIRVSTLAFCFLPSYLHGDTYEGQGITLDWLGKGYDTSTNFPKNRCVQGIAEEAGNTHVLLNYRSGWSSNNRSEEIFGKIKGSLELVIFSGSATIEFLNRLSENTTTAAAVLDLTYHAKDLILQNRKLTSFGQKISDQTPYIIRKNCGNEFVHSIRLGSNLYVVAKLHFRSRSKYEIYRARIKTRILFFSQMSEITDDFFEATKDAVYSLQVIAHGGVTETLQEIIDENPKYCQIDKIDKCIETSKKLFNYLFGENDYSNDLQYTDLQVTSFTTQPYVESGHFSLAPGDTNPLDLEFKIQEQKLQTKLVENAEHQERLFAFKAVEMDQNRIDLYTIQLRKVGENLGFIKEASDQCKSEPHLSVCRSAVEAAISNLNIINYD